MRGASGAGASMGRSTVSSAKKSRGLPTSSGTNGVSASLPSCTGETTWRCRWFGAFPNMDSQYADYMSNEWGRPVHGEAALFEALTLEGAQAGLSWRTILTKREAYRSAFLNFDADRVAEMGSADVERLLTAPTAQPSDSVVRHRGKLEATIANARAIQQLRSKGGLDGFLWSFVNNTPQFTTARTASDLPTTTPTAEKMSRELKALGFKFVGGFHASARADPGGFVLPAP